MQIGKKDFGSIHLITIIGILLDFQGFRCQLSNYISNKKKHEMLVFNEKVKTRRKPLGAE